MNFVCTFLKQYVYKMRCLQKNPASYGLLTESEYYQNVEFAIAKQECRVRKHVKIWSPIFEFED